MRIRRDGSEGSEIINMSSLLDVMFILIIFFLATTTFREQELDHTVSLPTDAEGESLSQADKVMVINIRKSGAYVVQDQQVTIEELGAFVAEAVEKEPNKKVLIRADQEALHGYVARAVLACTYAGIREANIGYATPKL